MNIPQTLGPNENYIILYYLSLSLSLHSEESEITLNFFLCLLSILSIYASKECYDMCCEKHAPRRRRRRRVGYVDEARAYEWKKKERKRKPKSLSNP
jgi:hypothetical protein